MSSYKINRPARGAYRLSNEAIVALHNQISLYAGIPATITIEFAEGRSIEGDEPGPMFEDSFLKANRVETVRIRAWGKDKRASIRISIGHVYPITLDIEGKRAEANELENNIINELQASKRWFSSIFGSVSWLPVGLSAAACLFIGSAITQAFLKEGVDLLKYKLTQVFILVSLSIAFFSILGGSIFPKLVFDFGRRNALATAKAALAYVLIFIFAMGIAQNWASDWMKHLLPSIYPAQNDSK